MVPFISGLLLVFLRPREGWSPSCGLWMPRQTLVRQRKFGPPGVGRAMEIEMKGCDCGIVLQYTHVRPARSQQACTHAGHPTTTPH